MIMAMKGNLQWGKYFQMIWLNGWLFTLISYLFRSMQNQNPVKTLVKSCDDLPGGSDVKRSLPLRRTCRFDLWIGRSREEEHVPVFRANRGRNLVVYIDYKYQKVMDELTNSRIFAAKGMNEHFQEDVHDGPTSVRKDATYICHRRHHQATRRSHLTSVGLFVSKATIMKICCIWKMVPGRSWWNQLVSVTVTLYGAL